MKRENGTRAEGKSTPCSKRKGKEGRASERTVRSQVFVASRVTPNELRASTGEGDGADEGDRRWARGQTRKDEGHMLRR